MIQLVEVNEYNWLDVVKLSVRDNQKGYLDSAVGIIARGYAYRKANARVFGIAHGQKIVGLALVKDLDEEPACYDLQQFMIGAGFQNRGYGTEALQLILSQLCRERRYDCVEVCVNKQNTAALKLYEKTGFTDTGYVDESVPDCVNLVYRFTDEPAAFSDVLITDFSDPQFQNAFKQYFAEIKVNLKDWEGLFREMNEEGGNAAIVRVMPDGRVIGFIQFRAIQLTSCFFEETCGFIREFWVAGEFRGMGYGTALIALAERHLVKNGIYTSLLTTDTAKAFYEKRGYVKAVGCKAKNQMEVFIKRLGPV